MKLYCLGLCIALVGCSIGNNYTDNWCLANEPFRPTVKEYSCWSINTKQNVLIHNRFGQKYCNWKP